MNRVSPTIQEALYRLNVGVPVGLDHLSTAFRDILHFSNAQVRDVLLGAFLSSLMTKVPTAEEAAEVIQVALKMDEATRGPRLTVSRPPGTRLVGAVGSGKKGVKTMNVSTPSMLVAACVGGMYAKPGSSSTSSVTGSADFMQAVGVNIGLGVREMADVMTSCGVGFFTIEKLIPRFDAVYGRRFHAPHVLSFGLPALLCPVECDTLLYGLAHPNITLSLSVLKTCGVKDAMVISCTHDGIHFMDEIGMYGTTRLIGMRDGDVGRELVFDPTAILGLPPYKPSDIAEGESSDENIRLALDVLAGKGQPAREDVICLNAANLLYLAGLTTGIVDGFQKAKDAVRSGMGIGKLAELIAVSGGDQNRLDRYLS